MSIRDMQNNGELPEGIHDFGQLHEHFDANVGWGDEVDSLERHDWVVVQGRVHELLAASDATPGSRRAP